MKIIVCLLASFLVPLSAQAQDESEIQLHAWFDDGPFTLYRFGSLVSADAKFLTNNEQELQFYEMLGMQFKSIDEEYLRRQLGLKEGQGLFVAAVEDREDAGLEGIELGDVLLQVNETDISDQNQVIEQLVGGVTPVKIRLLRQGQAIEQVVDVKVVVTKPQSYRKVLGVFGEEISDLSKSQLNLLGGLAITGFSEDSPAEASGILIHDIVTSVNDTSIKSLADLRQALDGLEDEQAVVVKFLRVGKEMQVQFVPKILVEPAPEANPNASLDEEFTLRIDNSRLPGISEFESLLSGVNTDSLTLLDAEALTLALQQPSMLNRIDELEAELQRLKAEFEEVTKKMDSLNEAGKAAVEEAGK